MCIKRGLPVAVGVLFLLALGSEVYGCLNPTDSYATEVVLNKPGVTYRLDQLSREEEVRVGEDFITLRSHHTPEVAVVLQVIDEGIEQGLTVRLQIPVKEEVVKRGYLTLESMVQISIEELELEAAEREGWRVYTTEDLPISRAGLSKEGIRVTFTRKGDETRVNIRVESGRLEETVRGELEKLLQILRFPITLQALVEKAGLVAGVEETSDLIPAVDINPQSFPWREALRVELTWLIENRVIEGLTPSDIDAIARLAGRGHAGHNLRIRYFGEEWVQGITREMMDQGIYRVKALKCEAFPPASLPAGVVSSLHQPDRTTDLLPPALAAGIIALGVILAARWILARYISSLRRGAHQRDMKDV